MPSDEAFFLRYCADRIQRICRFEEFANMALADANVVLLDEIRAAETKRSGLEVSLPTITYLPTFIITLWLGTSHYLRRPSDEAVFLDFCADRIQRIHSFQESADMANMALADANLVVLDEIRAIETKRDGLKVLENHPKVLAWYKPMLDKAIPNLARFKRMFARANADKAEAARYKAENQSLRKAPPTGHNGYFQPGVTDDPPRETCALVAWVITIWF
jgi:hypothetical protein